MEINGVEASFAPSSYDRSSVIKMAIWWQICHRAAGPTC